MSARPVKACGCGRTHDAAAWSALPRIPDWDMEEDGVFEQRNCTCGSTLLLPLTPARRPSTCAPPCP